MDRVVGSAGGRDKAQPFWRVLAEVTVILPLLLLVPELPK